MDTILQALRSLGPTRLAVMGGVVLGMIAFFIYLTTRLATSQMELLYSELEPIDSSRIVTELEAAGVRYEFRNNGTQILVPADEVTRRRMALASLGLPSGGSIGYEIFDEAGALGTTNFVQNINLVRALEGELARTIGSFLAVRSARVHLVLPRRELFSRKKQVPSAAIVLKMQGAVRLDKEQVLSIQHLVAAAVPGLTPTRITVIDNKGSLLARGFEDLDSAASMAAKADERKRIYENRMATMIESLLEKTVGFGRVRAEVRAEMDFDRINITEELFDPDGQVVRSTQTLEETASSRDAEANPPVSIATNLPDADLGLGGEGATSATTESRIEETVNFEVSKKVVNHVREVGTVTRLSVAVLVALPGIRAADGTITYEERSENEMELLGTLVRSAIGFNADRGDSADIIQMQFAEFVEEEEEELELFFGLNKNDLLRMAEILVLSIVAVLIILLVVRPLVTRAFEAIPAAAAVGAEGRLLAEPGVAPALTAPPGVAVSPEEELFEELIDIDRVEGRVKASSVKKVGEIVDKHPEEALSIVRSWMYQER